MSVSLTHINNIEGEENMKEKMLYKSLVVGVIVLFIGVGVQPAIAINIEGGNNPPDAPTIIGPMRGKPGVEYTFEFLATDPENENVSFYIEWGDGETTGWTDYYPSGEYIPISHTWDEIDRDNIVRAKAKDINGAESDWSTTQVPINKDDCNLCAKKVSNQNKDGVEMMINILSGLLKKYPIVEDELQDLREVISTPSEEECFKLNILFVDFQVTSERFLEKGRFFLSGIYFLLYLITHFLWKTYCNPP